MPRIFFVMLLLWQLIFFFTIVHAQDDILKCTIMDEQNIINLRFKKTNQLLANKHLPIWTAGFKNRSPNLDNPYDLQHELIPDVMNEIGDFILYHDLENSAAVVYFVNTRDLCGSIDTRYEIRHLPLHECERGYVAGGKYVVLRKNLNIHNSVSPFLPPMSSAQIRDFCNNMQSTPDEYKPPKKRQRFHADDNENQVTTLYPEILLFVSHEVTKITNCKSPQHYLYTFIKYYIAYFNDVDMLFAKLASSTKNIRINVNLAGMVFEAQKSAFPFLIPVDNTLVEVSNIHMRNVNTTSTNPLISKYLNRNHDVFPIDSFDFYFISTSMTLWTEGGGFNTLGLSEWNFDIYMERQNHPGIPEYMAGTIVQLETEYPFAIASHEIAHLMSIGHEPTEDGAPPGSLQCYAIMQEIGTYCPLCLKWTNENINTLQKYVRENKNHCFLLNKPRSIHPHGHRARTLTPNEQCRCYGYERRPAINIIDLLDEVNENECNKKITCGVNSCPVEAVNPVDGTPCAKDKVCWEKKCQHITNILPHTFENRVENVNAINDLHSLHKTLSRKNRLLQFSQK